MTSTLFDCHLTPFRTNLFIIGYIKTQTLLYIPLDIITLIIMYFNQILYFKLKDLSLAESGIIKNPNYFISDTCSFDIKIKKLFSNNILNGISASFNIGHNSSLFTVYDDTAIIFRVRIFCVETRTEIQKIKVLRATYEHIYAVHIYMWLMPEIKLCNLDELNIFSTLKPICIGVEFEILHKTGDDSSPVPLAYINTHIRKWIQHHDIWIKFAYPWNDNKNDIQLRLNGDLHGFDVECLFGVNNKYYAFFSDLELMKDRDEPIIMDFYLTCLSMLSKDVILLFENGKQVKQHSLKRYFLNRMKTDHKKRHMYLKQALKLYFKNRNNDQDTTNIIKSHDYCKNKKTKKLTKMYYNKKQRYKYHRW